MSDSSWSVQCFLDDGAVGASLDVRDLPLALALTDGRGRLRRWTRAFADRIGTVLPTGPDALLAVLTASGVPDAAGCLDAALAADQEIDLRVGGAVQPVRLGGRDLADGHRLWFLTDREARKPRGEFQSLIAHDLRSPLAVIQGYAGLLATGQPGPLNETQREFLAGIDTKIVEVTRLLDDFLDFSRLEAGALDLRPVPVEVDDLIARVVVEHGRRAGDREIRLTGETRPASLSVVADPLRLHQIIDNLVGNAVKYNHDGGWVRIEAAPAGDTVEITVSDGGPGLSTDDRERLFEPFARGGASGRAEGSGLGLVVVRRLVELHGGVIEVTSAPGEGAAFRVSLPVRGRRGAEVPAAEDAVRPV